MKLQEGLATVFIIVAVVAAVLAAGVGFFVVFQSQDAAPEDLAKEETLQILAAQVDLTGLWKATKEIVYDASSGVTLSEKPIQADNVPYIAFREDDYLCDDITYTNDEQYCGNAYAPFARVDNKVVPAGQQGGDKKPYEIRVGQGYIEMRIPAVGTKYRFERVSTGYPLEQTGDAGVPYVPPIAEPAPLIPPPPAVQEKVVLSPVVQQLQGLWKIEKLYVSSDSATGGQFEEQELGELVRYISFRGTERCVTYANTPADLSTACGGNPSGYESFTVEGEFIPTAYEKNFHSQYPALACKGLFGAWFKSGKVEYVTCGKGDYIDKEVFGKVSSEPL